MPFVPSEPKLLYINFRGAHAEMDDSESSSESYDSHSCSDLEMNGQQQLELPQTSRPLRFHQSMNFIPDSNINSSNQG